MSYMTRQITLIPIRVLFLCFLRRFQLASGLLCRPSQCSDGGNRRRHHDTHDRKRQIRHDRRKSKNVLVSGVVALTSAAAKLSYRAVELAEHRIPTCCPVVIVVSVTETRSTPFTNPLIVDPTH